MLPHVDILANGKSMTSASLIFSINFPSHFLRRIFFLSIASHRWVKKHYLMKIERNDFEFSLTHGQDNDISNEWLLNKADTKQMPFIVHQCLFSVWSDKQTLKWKTQELVSNLIWLHHAEFTWYLNIPLLPCLSSQLCLKMEKFSATCEEKMKIYENCKRKEVWGDVKIIVL